MRSNQDYLQSSASELFKGFDLDKCKKSWRTRIFLNPLPATLSVGFHFLERLLLNHHSLGFDIDLVSLSLRFNNKQSRSVHHKTEQFWKKEPISRSFQRRLRQSDDLYRWKTDLEIVCGLGFRLTISGLSRTVYICILSRSSWISPRLWYHRQCYENFDSNDERHLTICSIHWESTICFLYVRLNILI